MTDKETDIDHISRESFEAKFPHLVLGRYLVPKKRHERRMLLLSTVCDLDADRSYSEAEINGHLKSWIERFGMDLSVDHVTLRRYLVDEAILDRDPSGSQYSLSHEDRYFTYDRSIRSVDLDSLVSQARSALASRKSAYLAESSNDEPECS